MLGFFVLCWCVQGFCALSSALGSRFLDDLQNTVSRYNTLQKTHSDPDIQKEKSRFYAHLQVETFFIQRSTEKSLRLVRPFINIYQRVVENEPLDFLNQSVMASALARLSAETQKLIDISDYAYRKYEFFQKHRQASLSDWCEIESVLSTGGLIQFRRLLYSE